ncbi:hypothetical protein GOB91_27155 [Sinorhizobium meliloti]|nr:hypothetical protein [Sinorhizobium meliloti]MDW9445805.1 hypothetical protein [Sinorhizobium meliloti]MDW9458089.1 hypothetical protein [Sinorhizobium meliloti]MDW9468682.1 hypothetical protein [Sinorhizobium meliloti]MDW9519555.1 hypothetical protein [Sinorhizobium meliloti]
MNVIDSQKLERDAGGKPHTLFLTPFQHIAFVRRTRQCPPRCRGRVGGVLLRR